jgi:hypothetical protein
MREFARCIAWTLALGTAALLFAMFGGGGLEHADGPQAWVLFSIYAPYYLLDHGTAPHWPGPLVMVAAFLAQFAYFLAAVAIVRSLARGKVRWRRRAARQ